MGKTIIQPIGPLYGEAVNGTVYGRPNGSIYIPPYNTIKVSLSYNYAGNGTSGILICNSSGSPVGVATITAESQDNAAYCVIEISASSDFASVASRTFAAGSFNLVAGRIGNNADLTITAGETYYVRARLVSGSGESVAVSDVIEIEGRTIS